jgi:hypothetical protein
MKIITIMADFGMGPFAWLRHDDSGGVGGCIADAFGGFYENEFSVSDGLTRDFAEWARKFERTAYNNPDFPWKAFHAEGIALTRRLKNEIGNQARVLYCRPMEDPDRVSDRYAEFLVNGSMIWLTSPQRRWRPSGR